MRLPMILLAASINAAALPVGVIVQRAMAAEPGEALDQLLENVRYWQARGRPDKAAEAWRKVLKSVPNHPEALAELALFSARAGKNDEAKGYLERLRKAQPGNSRIPGLEQALGLGAKYDDLLTQARNQVRAGKIGEGLDIYRKLFGGQAPSGAVGMEYYQTLGGTANGWEEARVGLLRLMNENPSDARFELAYARHLTYVETTRRDGVDRLERLSNGDAKSAKGPWRQALMWLLISTSDMARYDRYLTRYPDDNEVKTRLAEARAGVVARGAAEAERERLKSGYDALDAQNVDGAEVIFRKALKTNPRDLDAMAGLGNALLRKESFDEAREVFDKVKAQAPKRKELWDESLRSAEFWSLVKKAEAQRADGKLDEARAGLEEAIAKSPKDAANAELVLANVYVDAQRFPEAQALFEVLAEKDPKNVAALKGLVELYLRSGDQKRALATNEALAAIAQTAAYKVNWIRAEVLRRDAVEKRKLGLLVEAESLLDAAAATDPTSRNVLLEQTYTYLDLGKNPEARGALDKLDALAKSKALETALGPDGKPVSPSAADAGKPAAPKPDLRDRKPAVDKEVAIARAWVLAGEQRYDDGLDLLQALKDGELDAGTKNLKRRLQVQADVLQALKLAGRGKQISAQARLTELQRGTRDEPDLMGLVANAWADMGKYDQALAVMYDALSASKSETPTLKLQLAGILHKADREADLLSVLRELDGEASLTPPERQGLANLKIAYSVKRADIARESGFLARAFNLLQDPLKDYPDDPRLMTALGRLFLSAGEYTEASELFARVLVMKPSDLEARQGAIQSAVELGHEDGARKLADDGLKLADDDPRMYLVAGRMHVLIGEDGEAMESFERALALEEGRSSPELDGEMRVNKLLAGAERRFGGGKRQQGDDLGLRSEIAREIDRLRARHAIRIGTSVGMRVRRGTAGTSQMFALDMPTWMSIPTGYRGRLTFTATPVLLDAGAVDLDKELTGSRFGTTGVDLFGTAAGSFGQGLTGVELGLAEEFGGWRLDIGSTALGFPIETIVGGFAWNATFGEVGFKLQGYRRAMIESLLSWGGAEDIATQTVWGGVTKNGGRLDLGITVDEVVFYLVGGGNLLLGERVAENWSAEAGTGISWRLYDWEGLSFTTGLDVSTMFFDKNLRHFTLGHGGYFSPQAFASFGFPLRLASSDGDLTYQAQASIGLVWFREDDVGYYPTDPARQALREELVTQDDEPVEAFHKGQEGFAFAFNFDGELAYEVTRGLKLGVQLKVHSGHDFQEYEGGVILGYTFQQRVAAPGERSTPFGEE